MANYNIQKESTLHLVLRSEDGRAQYSEGVDSSSCTRSEDGRAQYSEGADSPSCTRSEGDRAVANYNIQKELTLHLVLDQRGIELWRITISRRSRLSILY